MGRLIYFDDHHPDNELGRLTRRRRQGESLIPLQLALDEYDIEACFTQLARFGRCSVYPRANPADPGKILFLVRLKDAINLNRYLLEEEGEDSPSLACRIDHIQMLENCEESLISKAWDTIGLEAAVRFDAPESGAGLVDRVRQ